MANELVLARVGGALSTTREPFVDTLNVFGPFREVFAASRCSLRKVYWFEEKWGRTVLRQLVNTQRLSKDEDRVLTTMAGAPDLDRIKLAIAKSNFGGIQTGIRWELYRDATCQLLVDHGRFDHIDLLPDDAEQREALFRTSPDLGRGSAWDFDGLILTHQCVRCFGIMKDTLILDPDFMECQACGFNRGLKEKHVLVDYRQVIRRMLMLLQQGRQGTLAVQAKPETSLLSFLDIHATVIVCWLIRYLSAPLFSGNQKHIGGEDQTFPIELVSWCYNQSLLALLENPITRNAFVRFVEDYYRDRWDRLDRGSVEVKSVQIPEGLQRDWIKEEAFRLLSHITTLQGFRDWFFGSVTNATLIRERMSDVLAAATDLPGFLETYILELGKQLITQEERVEP